MQIIEKIVYKLYYISRKIFNNLSYYYINIFKYLWQELAVYIIEKGLNFAQYLYIDPVF